MTPQQHEKQHVQIMCRSTIVYGFPFLYFLVWHLSNVSKSLWLNFFLMRQWLWNFIVFFFILSHIIREHEDLMKISIIYNCKIWWKRGDIMKISFFYEFFMWIIVTPSVKQVNEIEFSLNNRKSYVSFDYIWPFYFYPIELLHFILFLSRSFDLKRKGKKTTQRSSDNI